MSGCSALLSGVDFQKIKNLAVVDNHEVRGYYDVEEVKAVDMTDQLKSQEKNGKYKGYDKPFRVQFLLGCYKKLLKPFTYGLDSNAAKGVALCRKDFQKYVKGEMESK